jgi:hypothetical protein
MISKVKTLLIIGLIVFIVSLLWQNGAKQEKIDKLTERSSFEQGVMADNIKSQAVIYRDKIVYKERKSDNKSTKSNKRNVKTSIKYNAA